MKLPCLGDVRAGDASCWCVPKPRRGPSRRLRRLGIDLVDATTGLLRRPGQARARTIAGRRTSSERHGMSPARRVKAGQRRTRAARPRAKAEPNRRRHRTSTSPASRNRRELSPNTWHKSDHDPRVSSLIARGDRSAVRRTLSPQPPSTAAARSPRASKLASTRCETRRTLRWLRGNSHEQHEAALARDRRARRQNTKSNTTSEASRFWSSPGTATTRAWSSSQPWTTCAGSIFRAPTSPTRPGARGRIEALASAQAAANSRHRRRTGQSERADRTAGPGAARHQDLGRGARTSAPLGEPENSQSLLDAPGDDGLAAISPAVRNWKSCICSTPR